MGKIKKARLRNSQGRVVELADTLASGASGGNSLRVQLPPRPQKK